MWFCLGVVFISDKPERADHGCMELLVRWTDIGRAAVCSSGRLRQQMPFLNLQEEIRENISDILMKIANADIITL